MNIFLLLMPSYWNFGLKQENRDNYNATSYAK